MFRGVRAYSGCIRSRGPYCGMSYECVEANSELVLRQDPINIVGACGSSSSSYPILLLPVSTLRAVACSGGSGCCGGGGGSRIVVNKLKPVNNEN
jgi:hypothetical protein